jgi:hypothetical protein
MSSWDTVKETLRGAMRSRTVWLNTTTALLALLLADPAVLAWAVQELGKENIVRVFGVIAAVNVWLRFDTDRPVRDKAP